MRCRTPQYIEPADSEQCPAPPPSPQLIHKQHELIRVIIPQSTYRMVRSRAQGHQVPSMGDAAMLAEAWQMTPQHRNHAILGPTAPPALLGINPTLH